MATVLGHFYNESYLLPSWLRHHRDVFDHGILIDYHSTDDSMAICRALVPGWEIRTTRNDAFDAVRADQEIMDIESEVSGWKIVLNTTEFLCGDIGSVEASDAEIVSVPAVILVDQEEGNTLDSSSPLVPQYWNGFFEADRPGVDVATTGRSRFLHRYRNGDYSVGRHMTHHPNVRYTDDLAIFWFGFAPWTERLRQRKLQIQDQMSEHDKANGFGIQHLTDRKQLEVLRERLVQQSCDLRYDPRYIRVMSSHLRGLTQRGSSCETFRPDRYDFQ